MSERTGSSGTTRTAGECSLSPGMQNWEAPPLSLPPAKWGNNTHQIILTHAVAASVLRRARRVCTGTAVRGQPPLISLSHTENRGSSSHSLWQMRPLHSATDLAQGRRAGGLSLELKLLTTARHGLAAVRPADTTGDLTWPGREAGVSRRGCLPPPPVSSVSHRESPGL